MSLLQYPQYDRLFSLPLDSIWMPNLNIIALSQSIPLIVTVHDISFEIIPEVFSSRMRMWHSLVNPRRLLRRAQHIVAVSHSTKQDILDMYGLPEDNVSVVYSGVAEPMALERIEVERFLVNKHISSRYILYVGTLEPRKNLEYALTVFESIADQYPELDFVLAGGCGWLYSNILKHIQKSRYRHRIHQLGFVSEYEKAILYNGATIFFYPSLYEGFGFPPLEAMSYGTPVIVSQTSALTEIVGNAAYKVSPYDVSEGIWALSHYLDSEQVRNEYRARGFQRVAYFDWKKTADSMLDIFRRYQ